MAQSPGESVPLHGRPDRSRDNQSEFGIADGMPHIDDHVRLDGSPSVLDRRVKIGRPRHAVTRGKHRRHTGVAGSGSQRATALATPIRHDRPAGPGPHPQPETVHTGTAPVIRLERPLALCHDSLLAASGIVLDTVSHAGGSRSPPRRLDRLCISLVTGAASGLSARIAAVSPTFGRLYEGTDRSSPGQTTPGRRSIRGPIGNCRHTGHRCAEQSSAKRLQCCGTVGVSPENC